MKKIAFYLSAFMAAQALALPPRPGNPGGGGGVEPPQNRTITGTVTFVGCKPGLQDVRVTLQPGNKTANVAGITNLLTGGVRMGYSVGGLTDGTTYTVTAHVPAACSGAALSPSNRVVQSIPSASQNFQVVARTRETVLDFGGLVSILALALSTMEMRLHNYTTNQSYVKLLGQTIPLALEPKRMDLDCGRWCPDLGDAIMYVNDMKLNDAQLTQSGSTLKLRLGFEEGGREIKGIHNSLGDNGVPDFELSNISINATPVLRVRDDGRMDLVFQGTDFKAGVASTGGCAFIPGLDLCDFFFGTDGKIRKGIKDSANTALNAESLRSKIAGALNDFLVLKGIRTKVVAYKIDGSRLLIYSAETSPRDDIRRPPGGGVLQPR